MANLEGILAHRRTWYRDSPGHRRSPSVERRNSGARGKNPEGTSVERSGERSRRGTGYLEEEETDNDREESSRSGQVISEDGGKGFFSEEANSFRETESFVSLPDYAVEGYEEKITTRGGGRGRREGAGRDVPQCNHARFESMRSARWGEAEDGKSGRHKGKAKDSNHIPLPFSRKPPPAHRQSQHFSSSRSEHSSRSVSDRRLVSSIEGRKLSTSSAKNISLSASNRRRKHSASSSATESSQRKLSQSNERRKFSDPFHPFRKQSAEISLTATGRKFSKSSGQGGLDKEEQRRVSGTYGGEDVPFSLSEDKRHGVVAKPNRAGVRLDLERVARADLERVLR